MEERINDIIQEQYRLAVKGIEDPSGEEWPATPAQLMEEVDNIGRNISGSTL